jgi:hypothetical protein
MLSKVSIAFIVVIVSLACILGSCIAPDSSQNLDQYSIDTIVPPIDENIPEVLKTATFSAG